MSNRWMLGCIFAVTLILCLTPRVEAGLTSTSACLATPTPTAQAWTEFFPSVNTDLCPTACMKWQMTCINMARASFRCFQALIQSLTVLDFVECSDLTGLEKAGCNASVKENQANMLEELQSDLQNAVGVCQSNLENCLSNCLD